jgi:hypothetical protein
MSNNFNQALAPALCAQRKMFMKLKDTLRLNLRWKVGRIRWLVLSAILVLPGIVALSGNKVVESSKPKGDRYYVRISGCDDGGKAYINNTLVVDVGFDEDSNWLDVTEDLNKKRNEIKFRAINRTGAITYIFQVKKNNIIVYEEACGEAKVNGCENNRAFRVGVAREFTYKIYQDQ